MVEILAEKLSLPLKCRFSHLIIYFWDNAHVAVWIFSCFCPGHRCRWRDCKRCPIAGTTPLASVRPSLGFGRRVYCFMIYGFRFSGFAG